jgi:signal transduction histidine kinase
MPSLTGSGCSSGRSCWGRSRSYFWSRFRWPGRSPGACGKASSNENVSFNARWTPPNENADLHDGVVQGLAGASYSLSAMAERAESEGLHDMAQQASSTAARLREWMRELRSLVVSIAPPKLHEEGLAAALSDVAATARSRGVSVRLEVPDDLELSSATETLLYRVGQEAVRNTIAHAEATEVTISLAVEDSGVVVLEVRDNGVGIASRNGSSDGDHLGLRLLSELVGEAGGRFDVHSGDRGTTVAMKVPAR